MLQITPEVRDHMFAHALDGLPLEACGMFSVRSGHEIVDRFHPIANAAESALVFELAGQEMLDLERHLDEVGREVRGVMHSHTHTSAYPSPTDVTDVSRFDPFGTLQHVIVSLRHAEPVMRCFRIRDRTITEVPIEVDTDDPVPHDQAGAMSGVTRLPRRPPQP